MKQSTLLVFSMLLGLGSFACDSKPADKSGEKAAPEAKATQDAPVKAAPEPAKPAEPADEAGEADEADEADEAGEADEADEDEGAEDEAGADEDEG